MPRYTFKCTNCGLLEDHFLPIKHRSVAQVCSGCGGPADRDVAAELAGASAFDETTKDHVRYSRSMGVNPSQVKEAEKNFPGSRYTPDGRLIINNRQHKLMELKRRGMIELN